jgi:hypothetical protein
MLYATTALIDMRMINLATALSGLVHHLTPALA